MPHDHMKNFSREKYLKEQEKILFNVIIQCNNVNEMFETFQNNFLSIKDNNAPIIALPRKESKLRQKLWLTKDILESIMIKKELHKKSIDAKSKIISGLKDISSIEARSIC